MNVMKLSSDLRETADEFSGLLQSLTQPQIDEVPFEDSWTAGQVTEHILKSAEMLVPVLHGKTAEADRQADEKVAILEALFLNFDTRMKSPEFILPTHSVHPKEALLTNVKTTFDALVTAADSLDLSRLCLDFELPNMGKLTGYEWCTFVLTHTQRHVHQLTNIVNKLAAATA